jgi:hypothetical protein
MAIQISMMLLACFARLMMSPTCCVRTWRSSKAAGLPRYFGTIGGGETPGSKLLDPQDRDQVAAYMRVLGVSFVLEGYDPHPHIRAKVAV